MTPRAAAISEPVDLRDRILEASIGLLEEQGVGGLSMREVARRAGVSHQAPYHHFADREAILAAIAEDGFRRLADALEAVANLRSRPVLERFEGCARAYVLFACDNPAHFRVMFRPELVRMELYPACQTQGDRAFACLVGMVRELVAVGLPPEPSEEAVVATAWSAVHGLACLLIDGPLSKKFPGADPASAIASVTSVVGSLFSAAIQPRRRSRKASRARRR